MYAMPGMEDIGLKKGQEWPTEAHRDVAQKLCLCNQNIFTAEVLQQVVQAIIKVPNDKIKQITLEQLVKRNPHIDRLWNISFLG
jgi:hypothetical protein